ncbi:MAG: hypothetical protein EOO12_01280 [Chitinophagaceae bacterium]|nr:MAG: hypothetical protein EOO12_01280 [Chitinophagaceae bacterium]
MSGRGDNNKRGSSGAGTSNQSGQAVPREEGKMNHGKQTGGQPSTPMGREREQDAQRNTSIKDNKGERS